MKSVRPAISQGNEVELSNGVTAAVFGMADNPGVEFVVTRWEFSAKDRQAVTRGQDVFLIQTTDNRTVNPATIVVGSAEFEVAAATSTDAGPTDSEGVEDPDRMKTRETELL